MGLSMLLNCTAGRLNAFCQKIAETRGVRLKGILLAGAALLSTGTLVMLNNTVQERLSQVERHEKTVQAMSALAKKQALPVKALQVSEPLRAVKESAAKAGVNLAVITSNKQQVRLRISETTLPVFIAWVAQLNHATGIQLSQVTLLPDGSNNTIQVEALLSWESAS